MHTSSGTLSDMPFEPDRVSAVGARLLLLLRREPFSLTAVDLCLLNPIAQGWSAIPSS
jgi:hypothetical protein